ncbi:MAG TPA: ABC transporter ATP-binding protein [Symbiobacteriaceae bacterium]|nr:ABC transporter ATP-binding protein [Symbiobacteriaceae bacterium]
MQTVRIKEITKRFDQVLAVAGVSLDLEAGELFTLLGPSGCGKTTLLRLLAGLEAPDSGAIYFGQQRVDQAPVYARNIGMVFQNYAIFPHMSVADNVAYGLRARKLPESAVKTRVAEALEQVQMAEYGPRRPDQLSGGQQQRVALARALATRPAVLLMDEPLSNLDARLRLSMRAEIRRLQKRVGITTIYVTHDQEEALAISDRIAVMEAGRILQVGSPVQIYRRPAHRAVAAFVGTCSFIQAGPLTLGLRPEMVTVLPMSQVAPPDRELLRGTVEEEIFQGAFLSVRVRLATGESVVGLSPLAPGTFAEGTPVRLAYNPAEAYRFDGRTGEAAL